MKFTVERKTWCRGDLSDSYLLNKDGNRCCLGFYAKTCGVTDEAMRLVGMPVNIRGSKPKGLNWLSDSNYQTLSSQLACEIANANDNAMDEMEREKRLKELFKQAGIEVEFV